MSGGIANIYVVSSPLHYLCARMAASAFGGGGENHLFFTREFLAPTISREGWDSVTFMPWPRHHPMPGPFGRIRRTRANLDLVAARCAGAGEIRLHAPVIDTEAVNYHINALKALVAPGRFSVRLLPDGLLNLTRRPQGALKEIGRYGMKLRRLVYPSLDYHLFRGDRTGSDAPIVDRIYVLPGFPHEYDQDKVVALPPFAGAAARGGEGKALVVGQPLAGHRQMSRQEMEEVAGRIRRFLAAGGARELFYKPHPRDGARELFHPDYSVVDDPRVLEMHLADHPYALVVGVWSTALVTARLILGPSSRVVSVGLEMVRWKDPREGEAVRALFAGAGVEALDVEAAAWEGKDRFQRIDICPLCGAGEERFRPVARGGEGFSAERAVACLSCGLVFLNPRLSAAALRDYYLGDGFSRDFRGGATPSDEDLERRGERARRRWDLLRGNLPPAGDALEIGCGAGSFLSLLKRAGWRVRGIDPSTGYAESARSRGLDVTVGNFPDDLPGRERYRLISVFHVLEHVPDPVSFLSAVRERLADDGLLLLEYPDLERAIGRRSFHETYFQRSHLYDFTLPVLTRMLAGAGLKVRGAVHDRERARRKNALLLVARGEPKAVPADPGYGEGLRRRLVRRLRRARRQAFWRRLRRRLRSPWRVGAEPAGKGGA